MLAISLLALAGVLWASLAAAQHIRRARKRRRGSRYNGAVAAAARPGEKQPPLPPPAVARASSSSAVSADQQSSASKSGSTEVSSDRTPGDLSDPKPPQPSGRTRSELHLRTAIR